ncbi:MAG: HD domain-containing protein [Chitinispirillaceae bacterium]|nr:HD domain-containing protein [Chitinispirillaceae bacterium]
MLHITPEILDKLCADGKLIKYKTSKSLYQYDFAKVIECRKTMCVAVPCTSSSNTDAAAPADIPVPVKAPSLSSFTSDDYQKIAQDLIMEKQLEKQFKSQKYRNMENSTYQYFIKTPLYCKSGNAESYSLYKSAGESIPKEKLDSPHTPDLYILESDWNEAYTELRQGMISRIRSLINNNEFDEAKKIMVMLLDFILFEHDEQSIEGLEEVVEVLYIASSRSKEMVLNLVPLLEQNLTLGLHSSRIMALAMKFCIKNNYSIKDSKLLCTSALLHDIGKTMLPAHLITANPDNLTNDEDIRAFRLHPQVGFNLLEDCGIKDKIIDYGALEHHERIDGSGFPGGKTKISFLGQIIGIFDVYDTLRNGRNQAGVALTSIDALRIMKKECDTGKFSRELFQTFVYSLL